MHRKLLKKCKESKFTHASVLPYLATCQLAIMPCPLHPCLQRNAHGMRIVPTAYTASLCKDTSLLDNINRGNFLGL